MLLEIVILCPVSCAVCLTVTPVSLRQRPLSAFPQSQLDSVIERVEKIYKGKGVHCYSLSNLDTRDTVKCPG